MTISIITLFPEMFPPVLNTSILKRAQEKGKVAFNIVNLRDFGIGLHKQVDDAPYGGGAGMVLRVDVLDRALSATRKGRDERVILLDPAGKPYTQAHAEELSRVSHLIVICGHYEGFDARIRTLVDLEISIGDYIVSGGEIPAMVIADSVTRLVPGVLKKKEATQFESFAKIGKKRILEYPQYTRPQEYNGVKVPDVLLSGDPKKIEEYRHQTAEELTHERRPDMAKTSFPH